MAHKLLSEPLNETKKTSKRFYIPNFNGKFGFALFIGKKEVFIGVSIGEVEIEQIIRKRMLKISPKSTVKVFGWD